MGRRSRKRSAPPPPAPAAGEATAPASEPGASTRTRPPVRTGRPASVRARLDEAPPAPWAPVPLVELCVLVGLILLVLGALNLRSDRGKVMLVIGMALGSLGGLDTALREHLAGYRSHTTVIAALPAVTTAALLFFARAPWIVLILGAVAVFAVVFWWMRRVFMRAATRARRARG